MSRTEWSSTFPGGKAATPRPLASLAAQFSRHFSGHHRNAFSQHISLPIYHIPLVFSPSLLPPITFPSSAHRSSSDSRTCKVPDQNHRQRCDWEVLLGLCHALRPPDVPLPRSAFVCVSIAKERRGEVCEWLAVRIPGSQLRG